MVKCAVALCHSNADVKRSFSTKMNANKAEYALHEETNIELRAVKAPVEESGGVHKVPITVGLLKIARNSNGIYMKHLKEENTKKRQRS